MNIQFTDDQALLRRSIREFAESEIRPHVREWDEAQQYSPELTPKLAALDLMGIQFPERYGGAALPSVKDCICIDELARDYAFVRRQFGRPVGTFQSICAKLLDNAGRIEATRLLIHRAASMRDQGRRTTLEGQ